jgi:hypothetical protein
MQWDSNLVDDRTNDKINKHFNSINDKRAAGHKPTLTEILQGPDTPNQEAQGKPRTKLHRSLLKPMFLLSMLHPFAGHLKDWEKGVPVNCGQAWSREAIDTAVERGPHPTARDPESFKLVHEDLAYQVAAGLTEIVLWDDIKDNLPTTFKISPVAVIPQRNRRGRIILDLSFPVQRQPSARARRRMGELLQEAVNDTTECNAPPEGVKAIGQVMPRLFQFMADTPADKVVDFSKIDLSNGFCRMIVEEEQKLNFCYVMPDPPRSPIWIAVPSVLQMGYHTFVPPLKPDVMLPNTSLTATSNCHHTHWKRMYCPRNPTN